MIAKGSTMRSSFGKIVDSIDFCPTSKCRSHHQVCRGSWPVANPNLSHTRYLWCKIETRRAVDSQCSTVSALSIFISKFRRLLRIPVGISLRIEQSRDFRAIVQSVTTPHDWGLVPSSKFNPPPFMWIVSSSPSLSRLQSHHSWGWGTNPMCLVVMFGENCRK